MVALIQRTSSFAAVFSLVVGLAVPAHADVLFEGYSKVVLGGTHVGFAVQRYEFDSKKKEFIATTYLKTNEKGGNVTESLKARSTASLIPLSYQYTGLAGTETTIIDASFKGQVMTANVQKSGGTEAAPQKGKGAKAAKNVQPKNQIVKTLPKGTFLASFLYYLMLQGKEGIKTGVKYGFQAIAEEDAQLYTGESFVQGEEAISGINTFKVMNTFKGSRYVSYLTGKAEVIATRSPVQQVTTELVGSLEEATAGIQVNSSNLAALFGSVPKGTANVVARKATAPADSTSVAGKDAQATKLETLEAADPKAEKGAPKKSGVPGGKGLILKGQAADAGEPKGK